MDSGASENGHVYAQRTRFIPNGITKYFQGRYLASSETGDARRGHQWM
jgi:hypothetical protein